MRERDELKGRLRQYELDQVGFVSLTLLHALPPFIFFSLSLSPPLFSLSLSLSRSLFFFSPSLSLNINPNVFSDARMGRETRI